MPMESVDKEAALVTSGNFSEDCAGFAHGGPADQVSRSGSSSGTVHLGRLQRAHS